MFRGARNSDGIRGNVGECLGRILRVLEEGCKCSEKVLDLLDDFHAVSEFNAWRGF